MHGTPWKIPSKMGEKRLPFYQLLKGNITFEWTLECQKASDTLKEYLSQAPLLVSSIKGETLFMYLVVTEAVVHAVICFLRNDKILPVYYEPCTGGNQHTIQPPGKT